LDPNTCLRLATRLHFMLRRHLDQEFEISVLMQGGFEARAALRLCRNSGLAELVTLAHGLERAHRADAKASARRAAAAAATKANRALQRSKKVVAPVGRKAQDLAWSRDTSGFGLSVPPERENAIDSMPAAKVGWLARLGLTQRGSRG
jgi:hypothetical protein